MFFFIVVPHPTHNLECEFDQDTEISEAYASLTAQLIQHLSTVELHTLQVVVCHEVRVNRLGDSLIEEINSAETIYELLDTLSRNSCSNWINLKFFKVLARCSKSKATSLKVIREYEKFLHCKKLVDALEEQLPPEQHTKINDYVSQVAVKIKVGMEAITAGDLLDNRRKLQLVIFQLGSGILNIELVKKGCLEMLLFMPVHNSFRAYKMTLHNRHKFWNVNIMYIKIGKLPVVCNPIELKTVIYGKYSGKYDASMLYDFVFVLEKLIPPMHISVICTFIKLNNFYNLF